MQKIQSYDLECDTTVATASIPKGAKLICADWCESEVIGKSGLTTIYAEVDEEVKETETIAFMTVRGNTRFNTHGFTCLGRASHDGAFARFVYYHRQG